MSPDCIASLSWNARGGSAVRFVGCGVDNRTRLDLLMHGWYGRMQAAIPPLLTEVTFDAWADINDA
jgi:hypothetical protein